MKPAHKTSVLFVFGETAAQPLNVTAEVAVIGTAILEAVVPGAGPRVFESGSIPCPASRLPTGGKRA